ncbi:MAG: nucleotidyltransferase domain-containing protein [Candidatus Bathyarchaeota archaeon]|nr:nucleotidyltransferase domain-containing protein [Candidatus Bathyarchaeota archaeon]
MQTSATYPTNEHKRASEAVVSFFSAYPETEAVILTGSCARGKATRDSCLDIAVLVLPEALLTRGAELEKRWNRFYETNRVFKALLKVGEYSHVDLDFADGAFAPKSRGWTSGPDEFELEIGNVLVYASPLWKRGDYLDHLCAKWLPYYEEDLRRERLDMVLEYCRNNLFHVPLYVDRGLYFQAFHRLYDAFQEFLQALFISRRTYPIAYNKWIREQIVEILGTPDLYQQLPKLFKIETFEGTDIAQKARDLSHLLEIAEIAVDHAEEIYEED